LRPHRGVVLWRDFLVHNVVPIVVPINLVRINLVRISVVRISVVPNARVAECEPSAGKSQALDRGHPGSSNLSFIGFIIGSRATGLRRGHQGIPLYRRSPCQYFRRHAIRAISVKPGSDNQVVVTAILKSNNVEVDQQQMATGLRSPLTCSGALTSRPARLITNC
jgi:hypothetical protein